MIMAEPFGRFSICRRPRAGIIRSASRATPSRTNGSDGRRTLSCAGTPASTPGPGAGRRPAGSWPGWRSIPASRSPASASTSTTEACRTSGGAGLLQPAHRRRAAHKGGQVRAEADAALMHALGGKRSPAPTARPGLQPRHLPAYAGNTRGIERRSPTSLRKRPTETGARMVRHARHAIFRMAEAALPRSVFTGVLALVNGFHMTGTAAAAVSVRSADDGKGVAGAGHRVAPLRRHGIGQHARRIGALCLDRRPRQRHSQWREFKWRIPIKITTRGQSERCIQIGSARCIGAQSRSRLARGQRESCQRD